VGSKQSARLFKAIKGAKSVLTFSEPLKATICGRYHIPADKVGIVHAAGFEIHRVSEDDLIASVKERYTSGCAYFLYTGSFHDPSSLVNLLKAFSIFKKRQKTSWKLVLINREQHPSAVFTEALRTYKYREEVVVLQENEDLGGLLSAAYAFVAPGVPDEYGLYILEAMRYGLPVLAGLHSIVADVGGDATLNFDGSVPDLAEKMMLLYKDENLRSHKVEAGNKVVSAFSWERTAQEIWEYLK
jgi:glycosyltransferase involved in cell wall biosynthesis